MSAKSAKETPTRPRSKTSEVIQSVPRRTTSEANTRTAKRPRKETFTIAYRVDGAALLWLEEKGAAYGMSAHEYARQRLSDTIADTGTDEMHARFSELKRDLQALREDMAITLEIILANITGSDPARIRAWIDDNLRRAE